VAGALLRKEARAAKAEIIPVDSEHSGVFQCLAGEKRRNVGRVILTASGGPFLRTPLGRIAGKSIEEALAHPRWKMGRKVTIDSATLMNKGLELIEARWLFDLAPETLGVLIHPQSIVHALVEMRDGSVIAQLSPTDMKIPIQYALTYPERLPLPVERVDLSKVAALTFQPPDPVRFPALRLAYEVLQSGGTAPTVLNAANEVAVAAFLADGISFAEILESVERTVRQHALASEGSLCAGKVAEPTLEQVLEADLWARKQTREQLQISPTSS